MKRVLLPLILFFFLIMEGVALDFLPESFLKDFSIVPHWVFVFLLCIAIFYDTKDSYYSVIYAIIFGLLIDIVYTDVLGIYMFSYTIIIYIIFEFKKVVHTNFIVTILLGIIGLALVDISINTIYYVIGVANVSWTSYFIYRLPATVLANILFLIILYFIIRKQLVRWADDQFSESTRF